MIFSPNAKINIGLQVLSKRDDGFHNISTFIYPIYNFTDILEIIENNKSETNIYLSGIKIEGDNSNNLCLKAYNLLKKDYKLPAINIYLHKIIPIGAGLGGGSSDAAATLTVLNSMFNLNLSNNALIMYAAKLGSDCAFFINNTPALATSKGEILENINININKHIVILMPNINISTASAYSMITPVSNVPALKNLISHDICEWKQLIVNDFETPIFCKHPIIRELKNILYDAGAIYAAMSGSGAAVYGIFNNPQKPSYLPNLQPNVKCYCFPI